jgi:misacylated tRNA(Ala) deacylase
MLEVAGYVAAEIVSKGQVRGAYVQRVDEGSGSALLGAVAGKLEGESGALVVLVAIQPLQSATSTSFVQLVGADEAEVKRIGEALRKFGVKGGGKGKRWSGKFTGVWLDKREGASMRAVIEEVVGPSANTTGVSNES